MATKKRELTAAQQKAEMQRLKQESAAWLLDYSSSRVLREAATAPRNSDGTYDAQALLVWAKDRNRGTTSRPELPDVEHEQLLTAAEALAEAVDGKARSIAEMVDWIAQRHGDRGLLLFLDVLTEQLREAADLHDLFSQPDPRRAAQLRRIDEERAQEARAREQLQTCVQCESCDAIRVGKTWKRIKPPSSVAIIGGQCPDCAG